MKRLFGWIRSRAMLSREIKNLEKTNRDLELRNLKLSIDLRVLADHPRGTAARVIRSRYCGSKCVKRSEELISLYN